MEGVGVLELKKHYKHIWHIVFLVLTSRLLYLFINFVYSSWVTFCSWFCWALMVKIGCERERFYLILEKSLVKAENTCTESIPDKQWNMKSCSQNTDYRKYDKNPLACEPALSCHKMPLQDVQMNIWLYLRMNHRFIYLTEIESEQSVSLVSLISVWQTDLIKVTVSTPGSQRAWFQTKHPAVGWRLQLPT